MAAAEQGPSRQRGGMAQVGFASQRHCTTMHGSGKAWHHEATARRSAGRTAMPRQCGPLLWHRRAGAAQQSRGSAVIRTAAAIGGPSDGRYQGPAPAHEAGAGHQEGDGRVRVHVRERRGAGVGRERVRDQALAERQRGAVVAPHAAGNQAAHGAFLGRAAGREAGRWA